MIRFFYRKFREILSYPKITYYRFAGVKMPFSVTIGNGFRTEGEIHIGERSYIDNDVRIYGRVNIGKRSHIQRGVHIQGNVDIGDDTVIGSYTFLTTMPEGYLKIGNDVLVNHFSVLGSSERVEIKDHCIFAPYLQITDAFHGFEDPAELVKHSKFTTAPIVIEENVWIGSGVVVLKGVTIGYGAVIGAKSLVTKNIPSLGIAYGMPAKVQRLRGEQRTTKENEIKCEYN